VATKLLPRAIMLPPLALLNVSLLASIDMDKLSIARLGTVGTINHGQIIIRKSTTIRVDRTYNEREATLDHDDIQR